MLSTGAKATAALVILLAVLAPVSSRAATYDEAQAQFAGGKYDEAIESFTQLLAPKPAKTGGRWSRIYQSLSERKEVPEKLFFGRGAARYQKGDFSGAVEDFSQSLLSRDPVVQEHSHYNLGNTHFRIGEAHEESQQAEQAIAVWEEAISHYEGALNLNPGFEQARTNLEITKKRIELAEQPGIFARRA